MTRAVSSLALLGLPATGCGTTAETSAAGTASPTPSATVTTVAAVDLEETCEQVLEPAGDGQESLLGDTNAYAVDLRDTEVFDKPLQQRGRDLIQRWEPVVETADPKVREHVEDLAAVPVESVAAADRGDANLDIQFRDYTAAADALRDACA